MYIAVARNQTIKNYTVIQTFFYPCWPNQPPMTQLKSFGSQLYNQKILKKKILQAVIFLGTPSDRLLNLSWHCVLTGTLPWAPLWMLEDRYIINFIMNQSNKNGFNCTLANSCWKFELYLDIFIFCFPSIHPPQWPLAMVICSVFLHLEGN